MPITFLPEPPAFTGPGYELFVQTDLIGPIGVEGWNWVVTVYDGPTFERACVHWSIPSDGQHQAIIDNYQSLATTTIGVNPHQGEQVHLQVQLQTPTGVQDESDAIPMVWDGAGNQWRWQQQQTVPVSGGFTAQDRTTLNTTHTTGEETNQLSLAINAGIQVAMNLGGQLLQLPIGEVLASNLIDFLTDRALSGGVTCDPVRYDASLNALYGVVVTVASFPEEWVFKTPDSSWGFHDLATVRIFRGGNLLERHGIHTTSHTIYPLPGLPFPWLTNLAAPLQPPDYHIWVDWAEGVCGELRGLSLP